MNYIKNILCVINVKHILIPNIVTYEIIFKNCEAGTALHFGKQLHYNLKNNDVLILKDLNIQMILIDMYGKCTELNECEYIFNDIKTNEKDKYLNQIKIWNSMINVYGKMVKLIKHFNYLMN